MSATPPELNDFIRDYLAALAARDTDFVREHSIEDAEAGYSGFHTGDEPVEWSIQSAIDTLAPLAPARLVKSNPTGWMIGDVAWFTDFPHGVLPNGQVLDDFVRLTVIARRAGGQWKVAHWHISEQVPRNLDADAPVEA